jgi:hypothetical protein
MTFAWPVVQHVAMGVEGGVHGISP